MEIGPKTNWCASSVRIVSAPGEGTTAHLLLPGASETDHEREPLEAAPLSGVPTTPHSGILVDDDGARIDGNGHAALELERQISVDNA